MLEELGRELKQVALAGVGAVAILAEKGGEAAKVCARRGADTVEKGRAAAEEWRARAEQAAQERRARSEEENLARMTRAERDALRRKLDELDAREAAGPCWAEKGEHSEASEEKSNDGE